jgi:hypothetical protein
MTSTSTFFCNFFIAALYKLSNVVSTVRYTLHMQALLEFCYILVENPLLESWNDLSPLSFCFSTDLHCQFLGVGQDMKQTYKCTRGILYFKLNCIYAIIIHL